MLWVRPCRPITGGETCLMPSLSPQIGPSTGSASANFPHPAFHPCVSALPLEGPSLEVREEACLQHQPGPGPGGGRRWAPRCLDMSEKRS